MLVGGVGSDDGWWEKRASCDVGGVSSERFRDLLGMRLQRQSDDWPGSYRVIFSAKIFWNLRDED